MVRAFQSGSRPLRLIAAGLCAISLAFGLNAGLAPGAQAQEGGACGASCSTGESVQLAWDPAAPVKVQGCWFKGGDDGYLMYATAKKGPYSKSRMREGSTVVDSGIAYYVDARNSDLYRLDLAKGGAPERLAKLSARASSVGAVRNGSVFVNYVDEDEGKVYVRVFDLAAGKLAGGSFKNASIESAGGEYAAYSTVFSTDASAAPLYVAPFDDEGGLDTAAAVRVAKRAYSCRFVGSTLMFASYKHASMKGTMYVKSLSTKAGLEGTKAKTVRTHKSKYMMVAGTFTAKSYVLGVGTKAAHAKNYLVDAKTGVKTRLLAV